MVYPPAGAVAVPEASADASRASADTSRSPRRSMLTLRNMLPVEAERRMRRQLPPETIFDRTMDVTELLARSQLIVAQLAALQAVNEVRADMLPGSTRCTSLIEAIEWGSASGALSRYEVQCLRSLNRRANEVKHGFRA